MESGLIGYLLEERMKVEMPKVEEELRQKLRQEFYQEFHQEEQQHLRLEMQQTLIEALANRFLQIPGFLLQDIWKVQQPTKLRHLIVEVVKASNLDEFTQSVKQAIETD